MSWFASILIGILSAAIGGVASGVVAGLYVEWYHVSSFEGGSGYFVVAFALLGIIAGLICGITVSRVVAAGASPGALKAMAVSAGILLGIATASGGIARFFADVPPTMNGEPLLLLVEVRYPASQTTSPAIDTVARTLRLGALSGHTQRKSDVGPYWKRDARFEDGHWIVPGAVELFTNRGTRVIDVDPAIPDAHGLLLPMRGTPGSKDLEWSEWMPRARPGAAPLPDGFTYRYKVVPRNQVVRTEVVGPFAVGTIASAFWHSHGSGDAQVIGARAEFSINYHGKPLAISVAAPDRENGASSDSNTSSSASLPTVTRVGNVAVLPGSPPALLVSVAPADAAGSCQMLVDRGNHVQATFVSSCTGDVQASLLTNDDARWSDDSKLVNVPGELDRVTYAKGGTYLFADAVFDADNRTVRSFTGMEAPVLHGSVGPLGLSNDHLSFVRLGFGDDAGTSPALVVIDAASRTNYRVSIDVAATRYGGADAIGPTWLNHYFMWQAKDAGHERLVARTGVTPLPYKGVLKDDGDGYLEYQVGPAGKAMAEVLQDFVRTEFNGERTPEDVSRYGYQIHIGKTVVHVFDNEHETHVAIFADRGTDASVVGRIAERFDAALATGKYDAHFTFNEHKQE